VHHVRLHLEAIVNVRHVRELETGAKGVFENLSNNVATDTLLSDKTYNPNANQSYGFTYSRQVYAYYLSSSFSLFHDFLEGKAGARYEYTHTTADFPGTHIPGYGIFSPSLVLQHKLDETQSFKAAYSYRIERPDYGDLNPFYNSDKNGWFEKGHDCSNSNTIMDL